MRKRKTRARVPDHRFGTFRAVIDFATYQSDFNNMQITNTIEILLQISHDGNCERNIMRLVTCTHPVKIGGHYGDDEGGGGEIYCILLQLKMGNVTQYIPTYDTLLEYSVSCACRE